MGEALRKKVEGLIRDRIKVKAEVKFARRIGNRNMILAKIDTFKGKIKIMVNKKILGTKDIYIENDKTRKEKEVQKSIVEMVKKEKEKDKEAMIKIRHWKMTINRKIYKWNENKGRLERQESQRKE